MWSHREKKGLELFAKKSFISFLWTLSIPSESSHERGLVHLWPSGGFTARSKRGLYPRREIASGKDFWPYCESKTSRKTTKAKAMLPDIVEDPKKKKPGPAGFVVKAYLVNGLSWQNPLYQPNQLSFWEETSIRWKVTGQLGPKIQYQTK